MEKPSLLVMNFEVWSGKIRKNPDVNNSSYWYISQSHDSTDEQFLWSSLFWICNSTVVCKFTILAFLQFSKGFRSSLTSEVEATKSYIVDKLIISVQKLSLWIYLKCIQVLCVHTCAWSTECTQNTLTTSLEKVPHTHTPNILVFETCSTAQVVNWCHFLGVQLVNILWRTNITSYSCWH